MFFQYEKQEMCLETDRGALQHNKSIYFGNSNLETKMLMYCVYN